MLCDRVSKYVCSAGLLQPVQTRSSNFCVDIMPWYHFSLTVTSVPLTVSKAIRSLHPPAQGNGSEGTCYGKYSLSFKPVFISAFDLLNFCLTFNLIRFIISPRSLANLLLPRANFFFYKLDVNL